MRHKLTKKVLSLLVTLAMLLSMVPMAYAEETTTVLTGFDELAKTEYIVETGTEQDALGLPDTLNATKQVVTQETTTNEKGEKVTSTVYTTEPVTVENVTWSGDYDANTAGTYTLTASAEGYESSVWPTVAVTLSDPEENVALAIGVTDIWDGSIATGFAGGMGTQEDPYLIATGAQLAFFGKAGI